MLALLAAFAGGARAASYVALGDSYAAGPIIPNQIAERIAATAPKVDAVLDGIGERAPSAKVFVVNYAAIFPETGFGCWPQMPIASATSPTCARRRKN